MGERVDSGSDIAAAMLPPYRRARRLAGLLVLGATAPVAVGAALASFSTPTLSALPLAQFNPWALRLLMYAILMPDVALGLYHRVRLLGAARRGEVTDLASALRTLAGWSFSFSLLVSVVALASGMMYIASAVASSPWRIVDLAIFLGGTAAAWFLILPGRRTWAALLDRWGVTRITRPSG